MDELEFYNGQYTGEQIDEGIAIARKIESDLASIHATGTTNTTGAVITAGTYFYLNGTLVRAKSLIDVNMPFTSGTNYEAVTAGGLNDVLSAAKSPVAATGEWKNSFSVELTRGHYLFVSYRYGEVILLQVYDNELGILTRTVLQSSTPWSFSYTAGSKTLSGSISTAADYCIIKLY